MGFSPQVEEMGEWESKLQSGIKENHYRDVDKMLWKQNKKNGAINSAWKGSEW